MEMELKSDMDFFNWSLKDEEPGFIQGAKPAAFLEPAYNDIYNYGGEQIQQQQIFSSVADDATLTSGGYGSNLPEWMESRSDCLAAKIDGLEGIDEDPLNFHSENTFERNEPFIDIPDLKPVADPMDFLNPLPSHEQEPMKEEEIVGLGAAPYGVFQSARTPSPPHISPNHQQQEKIIIRIPRAVDPPPLVEQNELTLIPYSASQLDPVDDPTSFSLDDILNVNAEQSTEELVKQLIGMVDSNGAVQDDVMDIGNAAATNLSLTEDDVDELLSSLKEQLNNDDGEEVCIIEEIPADNDSSSCYTSNPVSPSSTGMLSSLSSPCHSSSASTIDESALSSPASSAPFSPDPEWRPDTSLHSYSRSKTSQARRRSSAASSNRLTVPSTDRRQRKKEQNKLAATRYRQKKRQEQNGASGELGQEEKRNKELNAKYNDLKQELKYLKKIMGDVFVAKGIISADSLK